MHNCIFESSQLEGSYVVDFLYSLSRCCLVRLWAGAGGFIRDQRSPGRDTVGWDMKDKTESTNGRLDRETRTGEGRGGRVLLRVQHVASPPFPSRYSR